MGRGKRREEEPKFISLKEGELLKHKYLIKGKVGQGTFASVYLATHRSTGQPFILKIFADTRREEASIELEKLEFLEMTREKYPTQRIVNYVENFIISKHRRMHKVLVFSDLGADMLSVLRKHYPEGMPIRHIKSVIKQTMEALHYLVKHCRFGHMDIKPENILYRVPYVEGKLDKQTAPEDYDVLLCDMGACYTLPCQTKDEVQTSEYMAPESIFGLGYYTEQVDVWSMACVAFELAAKDYLFTPNSENDFYDCSKTRRHILDIIRYVPGEFTKKMLQSEDGLYYFPEEKFDWEEDIEKVSLEKRLKDLNKFSDQECKEFAEFLEFLLIIDPAKRPSFAEALQHPWLRLGQAQPEGKNEEISSVKLEEIVEGSV